MNKQYLYKTHDGSHTLYVKELDEYYHSIHGAVTESIHIFINSAFSFHQAVDVRIFEMGLGTGLNAFLTMIRAEEERRDVVYHAIEKYPLSQEVINQLNYAELFAGSKIQWFDQIHSCEWEKDNQLTEFFSIRKIKADLVSFELDNKYDIIYFDAFAPDKQPDLWSGDIFRKLFDSMQPAGILTTYSSKGSVRRAMELCGFQVVKLPGPPGKREMLRGTKSV
ncbi:MAG: tRNA (5-methylaminomethyl-2-thiouridine)(34)-methyltransferase MnmD [Bacteroidales bacterium]|nr:tRNA (5-methylaminomethyl-2-thiouridine)(34)-methyltransferase MnmD [Bacteroidales bacterium]